MEQQYSDQELARRAKLEKLIESGIDPYGHAFEQTHHSKEIKETYKGKTHEELEELNACVSVAGRIMFIRKMGKASFFTIKDKEGLLQVYIRIDNVGEEAYNLLLVILQDFQMYPKVIKYRDREKEIKEKIGFPELNKVKGLNPIDLSNYFIKKYNSNSKKCWLQYCKGIVSGARFLSQFKDYYDFKNTFDSFDKNNTTREAFALFLQSKIDNMGFAIACNWLKELGYKNYPKPDVHMKDICYAFGLIDENKNDIDCFEAMCKISDVCNIDPYKLDKVWWLICSGNFYRYNKQLLNSKKNKVLFIKSIVL